MNFFGEFFNFSLLYASGRYLQTSSLKPFSTDDFKTSRLQDFIRNFQKNIFTSVLAPQIAVASLGEPRMIRKENNCN